MAGSNNLDIIRTIFTRLSAPVSRVARFSYTEAAFKNQQIEGAVTYDFQADQNVPVAEPDLIETNPMLLDKGIRGQGASISRGFQNHFTGRVSYNLNMAIDFIGALIDWIASLLPANMLMYDQTLLYKPGDTALLISGNTGNMVIYTAYIRNNNEPSGIRGVSPTDTTYWSVMREYTSLAKRIIDATTTDLDNFTQTGLYWFIPRGFPLMSHNFPPVPKTDSGTCMVNIHSDINNNIITVQEVTFRDTAIQYTRTLSGTTVIKDWYISKDPNGLPVIGVQGLWAFKLGQDPLNIAGDNQYGHLYLVYDDIAVPPVVVDRDTTSPTYGHLIWTY